MVLSLNIKPLLLKSKYLCGHGKNSRENVAWFFSLWIHINRGVSAVRDDKLKLEEVKASHTLERGIGYMYLRRGKWIRRRRQVVGELEPIQCT